MVCLTHLQNPFPRRIEQINALSGFFCIAILLSLNGLCRRDSPYDMAQFPVTRKIVDSYIWLHPYGYRPPNRAREVDAIIKGVRKVFENLDQVPVE